MAFDPSVIASIGDSGPDPVAAKAKAYTLADMIDREQLNRGQLNEQKQSAADSAAIKKILQDSDLSTYEGKLKAGEAITKVSPQKGMDFIKETGAQRGQEAQNNLSQYDILDKQYDVMGTAAMNLKTMHDRLIAAGKNEAEVHAAMQGPVVQTVQQLVSAKLPNGQPVLDDQKKQWIQGFLSKGYDPTAIDSIVANSQKAREMIKTQLAQRKQDDVDKRTEIADKTEQERIRHDEATEGAARQKEKDKIDADKAGALNDDAKQLAVDRLLSGEKSSSVLGNLGRGKQGAADLRDIQNKLAETAKARGITGPQLVKIMQSTAADGRAILELGAREGKIASRVQEAQNFAEVAKSASADVPRGTFVPWNKLSQMSETAMSDPKLAKLKAATNSLVNAYAAAVGGGTPTVHDKEAADHMLSTAQSPEAYDAVVDQLLLETQKALDAPGQVRQRMTGIAPQENVAQQPATPPQTSAGAPPPQGGAQGGGGWGKATVVGQ